MDINPDDLVVYDDDGKLTGDSVKQLSDYRWQLRSLIEGMERTTYFGQAPPVDQFTSVSTKLVEVDRLLFSKSGKERKECERYGVRIKVIFDYLQSKSAAPPQPLLAPATPAMPQMNLPTFWTDHPTSWFTTVEGEFETHGVVDEKVRLLKAMCKLPPEVASKVGHVTARPFQSGDYALFKAALLNIYLKPVRKRLHDFLALVSARDMKPTLLLIEMRRLSEAASANDRIDFSDRMWKLLFVEALPVAIQASVDSLPAAMTLDELAIEADKFYDGLPRLSSVAAINEQSEGTTPIGGESISAIAKKSRGQWKPSNSSNKIGQGGVCNNHQVYGRSTKHCAGPKCKYFVPKKRQLGALSAASAPSSTSSDRLFVRDRQSGVHFLIDTGSDVSVIPKEQSCDLPPTSTLMAANKSPIEVYGRRRLSINIGFNKPMPFSFVIAAVPYAIIGADFLKTFHLAPYITAGKLINMQDSSWVRCESSSLPSLGISVLVNTVNSSITDLLQEFKDVTSPLPSNAPVKHSVRHYIETTGKPVHFRVRRLNPAKLKEAKAHFDDLLSKGIIRPSVSEFASPLHMVLKPNGEWRCCGDYRQLNAQTKPDRYPIPHIHDFTFNLEECTVFSKLDLVKAFYQIPVAEDDVAKTAVITLFGLFEFLRMPFGLRNAAQTFQRFIDQITRDLDFAYVYIDDILVASKSEEEHKQHLRTLLERLQMHGLTVNPAKCVFSASSISFLRHEISPAGIKPLAGRVKGIVDFPKPTTDKMLRKFLGMINHYHRFIRNAAKAMAPLHALLKDK